MLRRTAALAALTLAASLAAVTTSAAQAAEPTLVVPDSPSGDVVVTATADAATAPYLAVRLIRGAAPTAPYDGIDPAPVVNTGSAVDVGVPTWGLHNTTATFVLLGCTAVDPSTCGAPIASVERRVVQTVLASATVEAPSSQPVFVPEEQVYVTGHNPGGGRLEAYYNWFGEVPRQVLEPGVRTEFTAYPETNAADDELIVRRCSAMSTVSYCESPALARSSLTFLRKPWFSGVYMPDSGRPLTVNPVWSGSTWPAQASLTTYGAPYDLSWELFDSTGARVIEPVLVRTAATAEYPSFSFSPGRAAHGVLADGEYTAMFTATVTRGEVTKSTSVTEAITIANDPPRQNPRVLTAIRRIYSEYAAGVAYEGGLFRVEALPTDSSRLGPATFRLRNPAGQVVYTRTLREPCSDLYGRESVWDVEGIDLDRPGRYRAELTMPDSWGRPLAKDLGPVYVMRKVTVRPSVVVSAARSRVTPTIFRAKIPMVKDLRYYLDRGSVNVLFRGKGNIRTPSCRVLALSKAWQRSRLSDRRGWRGGCWYTPRRQLDGEVIQFRITDADGKPFPLREWKVIHTHEVWRMPE